MSDGYLAEELEIEYKKGGYNKKCSGSDNRTEKQAHFSYSDQYRISEETQMSNYEKPVVVMAEESTEGVYLASGDHLEQCRFGRTEASAGQMRARNVLRAVERELLLCREKNLQGEMILKAAWTICRSSSRNEEQYAASDHL